MPQMLAQMAVPVGEEGGVMFDDRDEQLLREAMLRRPPEPKPEPEEQIVVEMPRSQFQALLNANTSLSWALEAERKKAKQLRIIAISAAIVAGALASAIFVSLVQR
jgi:hypothetical protein